MKLRIILRLKKGPPLKFAESLKTIHEGEHVDIQSDSDVYFSQHSGDEFSVVIGRIIGLRTSATEVNPCQNDTKKHHS
jgi:hypothetical protein